MPSISHRCPPTKRNKTGKGGFVDLEWLIDHRKRKSVELNTVKKSLRPFTRIYKSISTPRALQMSIWGSHFCNYILHLKYPRHEPIITTNYSNINVISAVITCPKSYIFLAKKKKNIVHKEIDVAYSSWHNHVMYNDHIRICYALYGG